MKKFRLLSFLVLLMLFAASSYALPLTQAMYNNSGSCAYIIGPTTTGGGNGVTFYGDWDVNGDNYADLSAFSKLILNVSTSGAWRVIFNRVAPKGDYLEIYQGKNDDYYTWEWASDGTINVFIDLVKIKREAGFARLNVIKNRVDDNLIIKSAKVEMAQQTWDFTTLTQDSRSSNVSGYNANDGSGGAYWALNAMTNQSLGIGEAAGLTFTVTNNGRLGFRQGGSLFVAQNTQIFIPNMAPGNVITISAERHGGSANAGTTYTITDGTITTTVGDLSSSPTSYVYKVQSGGTVVIMPTNGHIHLKSISVDKTHVQIGHLGGTPWNEKFIDDNAWQMPVTLRDINDETVQYTGYATSDFIVTHADDVNVVTIGNKSLDDRGRLNVKLFPKNVGKTTLHIDFLGNDGYYPCSKDAEVTVKKHTAKVSFNSETKEVNFESNETNVSGLPTLTKWMDADGTNATYTVKYTSSNPSVASVDENTGAVTMHNSGVTVITANVVTTKAMNNGEYTVEAYTNSHDSYTLTVKGNIDQNLQLVWLSHRDADQGVKGRKYYGSYWTQKNLAYYGEPNEGNEKWDYAMFSFNNYQNENKQQLCVDNMGNVTRLPYGNSLIVSATAFTNMDWLNDTYQHPRLDISKKYSEFVFKLKDDTYVVNDEVGLRERSEDGWTWKLSNLTDYIPSGAGPVSWTDPHDGKSYNNVWMTNISYSISDPNLLDTDSKGECINSTSSEGQEWNKHYEIKPYPYLNDEGIITNDSITIYATIPGNGNTNPITISHKVLVVKGSYNLGIEPNEGYVTEGEWVVPYVNIPDIKLKDINKIYVWFETEGNAKVECEVVEEQKQVLNRETGQMETHTVYTLYQKDVTTSEWIRSKYDQESQLNFVDMIYPKLTGLVKNTVTKVHICVESPYYEDAEAIYKLHVVEDRDIAAFHWYINDDGSKGHTMKMGRDKGINDNREILFGEDDGEIKTIKMFTGDFIHMPGIVGTPNGNDEFSKAHENGEGAKYLYDILNGEIELNWDAYYYREGVPNYFFTTGYEMTVKDGRNVYTPNSDPLVPENHSSASSSSQAAFVIKEIATGENFRRDTLMIYGHKPGTLYLWAQDPQTHHYCTPIQLQVVSNDVIKTEKNSYMATMSYPYTWDFEHMDMTNIENDVRNNGSAYWEIIRVDEGKSPDKYQANGFFNADHDDKDGNNTGRQRWFKDLTTAEGYMPQFYGLMLNLSGMNYWDQKYNRFNVGAKGDYIEFIGGPHFLQLPGFGLLTNKTSGSDETYNYTYYDSDSETRVTKEGKDGTRKNDNRIIENDQNVRKSHNTINTLNYTAKDGYDYVSNATTYTSSTTDVKNKNKYRNNKVRFVIEASGNDAGGSQLHIGGKSMLFDAYDVNAIKWYQNISGGNENNKIFKEEHGYSATCNTNHNCQHPGFCEYNIKKRKVYVYELDPYDPEYQDHIYIMFNNDVKVYWMGISTEARELRSDYDNFSYSYPKDIDMDKTNKLMAIATKDGVVGKDPTKIDKNGYSLYKSVKGVDKVGTEITFNAYYASKYNANKEALTVTDIKENGHPNRFAGSETNAEESEGVIIYPSIQISKLVKDNATYPGFKQVTYDRTYTKWIEGEYAEKTMEVDGVTIPFVVPVSQTVTEPYSFQYLPTYFIANAQNVANYDKKTSVVKVTSEKVLGKENQIMYREVPVAESEYAENYEGIGIVPLLNGKGGIPLQSVADDTHKTNWNNSVNLLRPSTYTTNILMDYNVKGDGTIEAGTDVKGTMHATLTVAESANTNSTEWNRTNYTLTWKDLSGTEVNKNLNLPNGDLSGYNKLVVNCASVKADAPFVVYVKFSNEADPEEFVISTTGESEFDLTALGDNLKNVASITFGGNKTKTGKAVITDIYVTGPANDNRWINLGMSNEFVWRNLAFTDVKTMVNSLADQTSGDYNNNTMFELIGPKYVRFYRANSAENMRNRRAYLSLTWNEYNVDTYGKGGVNWNKEDEYNGTVIQIPDGVVAQIETNPSSNNGNENFGNLPFNVSVPGSLRRNPIRIVFNDLDDQTEEGVVSEDGGFPDGIKEIEESANADFNAPFYNLNGLRITNPSKGVYIQNGKKVIVR